MDTEKPAKPPIKDAKNMTINGADIKYPKAFLSVFPKALTKPISRIRPAIIVEERKYIVKTPVRKTITPSKPMKLDIVFDINAVNNFDEDEKTLKPKL
jgi:hypothetical protein